jgi:hypothetical protein
MKYEVFNTSSGLTFGYYEADSEDDSFDAMAIDDDYDSCVQRLIDFSVEDAKSSQY